MLLKLILELLQLAFFLKLLAILPFSQLLFVERKREQEQELLLHLTQSLIPLRGAFSLALLPASPSGHPSSA